jgi:hypothetical protein
MGPIPCAETSENNYHTTPRSNPEERRSHQRRGGSLTSNSQYFMQQHFWHFCNGKVSVNNEEQTVFSDAALGNLTLQRVKNDESETSL